MLFKIKFFPHREQTMSPLHHARKLVDIAQDRIKTLYALCGESAEYYLFLFWLSSFKRGS